MKLYLIPLFAVLFACQPSSKKEEVDLKALKDEVFAIHDEVMPKMGDLRRTRMDLMMQADSLEEINPERYTELVDASNKILAANEGMMQWMRAFEPDFEGTDAETLEYLNAQKESITKVRDDMLSSWEEGKKILEASN